MMFLTFEILIKYLFGGLLIGIATNNISNQSIDIRDIFLIGLISVIIALIIGIYTNQEKMTQSEGFRDPEHNISYATAESINQTNFGGGHPHDPLGENPAGTQHFQSGVIGVSPKDNSRDPSRWKNWVENCQPINSNQNEYKLVRGLYSKYIVQAGYNEDVQAGYPIGNQGNLIINEKQIENFDDLNRVRESMRLKDLVYSGDIIELMSGKTILQRGDSNSTIIFDVPLPKVKTNISKLRMVLAEGRHDPQKLTPIRYGDAIYLKHNALIDNSNQTRYIKYGERLQSHQEGPLFRIYKIVNQKDPKRRDYLKYGDEFTIVKGDQIDGDKVYLKIEDDKSVSCLSTRDKASIFELKLEDMYQLNERGLCVCPSGGGGDPQDPPLGGGGIDYIFN